MRLTRAFVAGAVLSIACRSGSRLPASGRVSPEATPAADSALKDTLVTLERRSWAAWQSHDGKFWQDFLSEDHVDVEAMGIMRKAAVVSGVASGGCTVDNYAVDNFRFMRLTATAAALTYRAQQATMCGKSKVPSPTTVTSVFVLRNGHWLNAIFQQSAQPAP